jgi:hypothetical protein
MPWFGIQTVGLIFPLDSLPDHVAAARQAVKGGGNSLAFGRLLLLLLVLLFLRGELGLVVLSGLLLSLGHVSSSAAHAAQRRNHSKRRFENLLPG